MRRSKTPNWLLWLLVALVATLAACDAEEQDGAGDGLELTGTPAVALPTAQATEPATPEMTAEMTAEATATPPEAPTAEPTASPAAAETAAPAPGPAGEVGLELVVDGLTSPVALVPAPDESGRMFVADQIGLIHVLDAGGQLLEQPFLDLRDRMVELDPDYDERGLLGLAFHPEYAENGRFFVYYSAPLSAEAPADWDHTSHIVEFAVSADDENLADPESEQILLTVDQPQGNHNAGQIAFGPDGYLYIPLGDGGAADDVAIGHVDDWYDVNEGGNGQDLTQNMLGDILRIDVDAEGAEGIRGQGYGIPADNPFLDQADVAPETYAYGFRNPYRITFDMGGRGELFVADAGQNLWEEVSIVTAGGNYGWNVKEGSHCFSTANPDVALEECPNETPDGEPLIDPVIEFANGPPPDGVGIVVVGGYVYRGSALAGFDGSYVFGSWSTSFDFPDGALFVATRPEAEGAMWAMEPLAIAGREEGKLNEYLLSFGQDSAGEIYVLTTEMGGPSGSTGKVYRIVPAGSDTAAPAADETATATPAA